jgi:hypothetical protein
LILARSVSIVLLGLAVLLGSCKSPLDLDVSRSYRFPGPPVAPLRVSVLVYYSASEAYEFVFTDSTTLSTIGINQEELPYKISIGALRCILPDSLVTPSNNAEQIRGFSIACANVVVDGSDSFMREPNAWVAVWNNGTSQLQQRAVSPTSSLRLQQAYFLAPESPQIRGTILVERFSEPTANPTQELRALVTIDY